jgi:hypothetical protein
MEAFTISMLAFRYGVADVLNGSIISHSLSKRRRKPRKKQPGNNLLKDQKGPVMRPFVYIFRSDLFAISFKSFDRGHAVNCPMKFLNPVRRHRGVAKSHITIECSDFLCRRDKFMRIEICALDRQ